MLTMETVTRKTPDLKKIRALYRRSFPARERRDFDGMLHNACQSEEILCFRDGATFVGMAILLNNMDISHIIYFAVEEKLRGHGYGTQALALMRAYKPGMRMIVDCEAVTAGPDSALRERRQEFYGRSGYEMTSVAYRWRGEDYVILSNGGNVTNSEFNTFFSTLPCGEDYDTIPSTARNIASLLLNLAAFLATFWAVLGYFLPASRFSGVAGTACLRYFTTDSNILAAIAAAAMLPVCIKRFRHPQAVVSRNLCAFKLTGTVAVAVTMFTVLFFLAPTQAMYNGIAGYRSLFQGNQFVLHLLTPLLMLLSYIFTEPQPDPDRFESLWALAPTVVYSIVYLVLVLRGVWPDWYGFTFGGKSFMIPISMLAMYLLTFLLTRGILGIRSFVRKHL